MGGCPRGKVLERVKDSVPKRIKECVLESIKGSPWENVIGQREFLGKSLQQSQRVCLRRLEKVL